MRLYGKYIQSQQVGLRMGILARLLGAPLSALLTHTRPAV